MRTSRRTLLLLTLCAATLPSHAQNPQKLRDDVQAAITRGVSFLKAQQNAEGGYWTTPQEPALSALVLAGIVQDPSQVGKPSAGPEVEKGYAFLLKNAQPDGGIYAKGRANYNTSISLMALVLRNRPEDEEIIRKARKFVAGQQNDYDAKGSADNAFDGGFGYGPSKPGSPAHADLSNTQFALEALYLSKKLLEDTGKPVDKQDDLNWGAAVKFIERCQNRPESNDQKWAGEDKKNLGAFTYEPGEPRGGKDAKGGPVAMRYYGSISYAGMLSFIYAGLTPDDPRVQGALQWLGENYSVEENPGMGAEGLFYYYHTMAKALATAGLDQIKTKSGPVDWRTGLASHLIKLQDANGSWKNTASSRWMESDPVLVTAYTVLALEHVHRALK
jgi:squalene-hopene/tetraprenyl-beta-curcumene cyclase